MGYTEYEKCDAALKKAEVEKKRKCTEETSLQLVKRQVTLQESLMKNQCCDSSHEKSRELDKLICEMIALQDLPFNFIEEPGAGVSLQSFTVHGINDDFKRVYLVLKCVTLEERHTGDLVAQKLDEIREEWDVHRQKLHAMVRDGGSYMRRAARISQIDDIHLASITIV
ncbi:unnamed protein product [Euphydryas editha]|uniref:Uncharacterized protein n=1 Tax=Euphydryas editha TaxID=104508 RepID=A0AAU9VGQ8_EUPED|nr:unnamed protein product [Euphydryas editha]